MTLDELRALDARVAEVVMGHTTERAYGPDGELTLWLGDGNYCPRYSSDLTAAWSVLERITRPEMAPANTRFYLAFQAADVWAMSASEAAEWICKAALAALEAER